MPEEVRAALTAAWRQEVPPLATALYARWWQLETWLRSLVYMELKTAFGPLWASELPPRSAKRQDSESEIRYMATADAQSRLAYTDVSGLMAIIERHWDLFKGSLISKGVWLGRAEELRLIRNRIGHCRRPHADDLARLEQTLRDLEPGAFSALSAFNRRSRTIRDRDDAVVDAWVHREHEAAMRLIDHAERQYETSFELSCSRRPWSDRVPPTVTISGTRGYVWHARWYFRGHRWLDLSKFWNADYSPEQRDAILLVCASGPSDIEVSFSALEDPRVIADAIGACFDTVLMLLRRGVGPFHVDYQAWTREYSNLDPRIQAGGPWAIVDASTFPISLFGA